MLCLGSTVLICDRNCGNSAPISVTSQFRMMVVKRAARPSGLAPGRKRPIIRSQEFDCFKMEFFPISRGSCCRGTKISGGSLRSVSP